MKKKNPINILFHSIYLKESRGGGFFDIDEHVRAYSSDKNRAISFNPTASDDWPHLGFRICRTTKEKK